MDYHYIRENKEELERIAWEELEKTILNLKEESESPLECLRNHMGKALTGTLDQKFYLSSIAPGYGKSKLVQTAVSGWVADGSLKEAGVLIALSTLEELKDYADKMALPSNAFAALTSDNIVNGWGLGSSNADKAQVLLTTHQMLRSRLKDSSFAAASCFHYKGKPRALRVWDESHIPAEPISFRADDLKSLPVALRHKYPAFIDDIEKMTAEADRCDLGHVIHVDAGLAKKAKEIAGGCSDIDAQQKAVLEKLASLEGCNAEVGKENKRGKTIFGCSKPFADDLAPLFILDGSGDVRTTYGRWEEYRKNLTRLPSVKIDYSKLTIHLWKRGSGQTVMSDPVSRQPIIDAITKLVAAKEKEEWLVIHRQAQKDDVPSLLEVGLGKRSSIRARNWGLHHGTNEFRTTRNIVLLGLLDYPETAYSAYHLAASGLAPGDTDKAHAKDIRMGELAHHLLQAISRGNVRNHNFSDDTCGECEVYLINSLSGMEDLLKLTFPGCVIKNWKPVATKPTNNERVQNYLKGCFSTPTVERVLKADVRAALGLKGKNTFGQTIAHKDFQAFLKAEGLSAKDHFYFSREPTAVSE